MDEGVAATAPGFDEPVFDDFGSTIFVFPLGNDFAFSGVFGLVCFFCCAGVFCAEPAFLEVLAGLGAEMVFLADAGLDAAFCGVLPPFLAGAFADFADFDLINVAVFAAAIKNAHSQSVYF